MLRKMLRVLMGAGIAGAMVVAATTPSYAAISTTRPERTVLGLGSDTTFEVMNDLDQLYNESPGCAVLPAVGGVTAYEQKCIIGGQAAYDGPTITTENLYHDRITEAFPVGSGNGATELFQYTSGNTAIAGDFTRSSSKRDLTDVTGPPTSYTDYGVAFARDGLGYWLGKTNTFVKHTATGPTANVTIADLKGAFLGVGGANSCLINYSASAADSIAATQGAPGAGNIKIFATQVGSGTGKDFLSKIDTSTAYTDATHLQDCIETQYKDGLSDSTHASDHIIFENNAKPICKQKNATGGAVSFQKSGLFPYSYARFVQNLGGVGACIGRLGKVGGVAPTITSIGDTSGGAAAYPLSRYVYNNFYVPSAQNVNDDTTWAGQTQAMLDYLHPVEGWLCETTHSANPISGVNYRTLIENVMKADGFAPLTNANVELGGGSTFVGTSYCRDGAST